MSTITLRPVSKKVKDAVKRQTSPGRFVFPACRRVFSLVMFVAVVGGCAIGGYLLWDLAMNDSRFRMDGETLALAGAVRECPESVAELEAIGRSFSGRSLFDPLLISDMEKAYSQSVWVKKVIHIRRRFPNRVELEFLIRMPAAQVWHDNRYWLIDSDGSLLPVAGSKERFPALPQIVGVTNQVIRNKPEPGGEWSDDGVSGALGIMSAFWGSPLAEVCPIDRVVVSTGALGEQTRGRQLARPRFEIVTTSGAVVRWGTFNRGELEGEITSSEKLYHLQELLRRDEALKPGICFDIRTRLPGFTL